MSDEQIIEFLWSLLDDVDTADDMAKGDDKVYRALARKAQAKRWETGITTDGYSLTMEDGRVIGIPVGRAMNYNRQTPA